MRSYRGKQYNKDSVRDRGVIGSILDILLLHISERTGETTTTTYYSTVTTTPTTMTTAPTTTVSPYSYLPTAKLISTYCTPAGPGIYNIGESGTADGPVGTWLRLGWASSPDDHWGFYHTDCGSWTLDENYSECFRSSSQPNSTSWSASISGASSYYYNISSTTPMQFIYGISYGAFDNLTSWPGLPCPPS